MMKEEIKIDLAVINDVDGIIDLVRSSFDKAYLETSIYRCKGIASFIVTELNNQYSPYRYIVAKVDNKIAGFAEFKLFSESSTAFLNMIATADVYKGSGVAKEIFSYSKNYLKAQTFSNIQLDVFKSNQIARQWYWNMGFVKEKSDSFYLLNVEKDRKKVGDMRLTNLPQFRCLYEQFEFSFLQISADNNFFNIGVIHENIIIRGERISVEILVAVISFLDEYGFTKMYYIGQEFHDEKYKFVDEIHRLKLIL